MKAKTKRTLRDLQIATNLGDRAAARALLRISGHPDLAKDVRANKPLSGRSRMMIGALTAGVGTHDKLGEWERIESDGSITNDLQGEVGAGFLDRRIESREERAHRQLRRGSR